MSVALSEATIDKFSDIIPCTTHYIYQTFLINMSLIVFQNALLGATMTVLFCWVYNTEEREDTETTEIKVFMFFALLQRVCTGRPDSGKQNNFGRENSGVFCVFLSYGWGGRGRSVLSGWVESIVRLVMAVTLSVSQWGENYHWPGRQAVWVGVGPCLPPCLPACLASTSTSTLCVNTHHGIQYTP